MENRITKILDKFSIKREMVGEGSFKIRSRNRRYELTNILSDFDDELEICYMVESRVGIEDDRWSGRNAGYITYGTFIELLLEMINEHEI